MEYLIVRFPDPRGVQVDDQPAGKANVVIALEAGGHVVRLDPPDDFEPREHTVHVRETTPTQPLVVTFVKTAVIAAPPLDTVPIAEILRVRLSGPLRQVLETAQRIAVSAATPLDASMLLFATVQSGVEQGDLHSVVNFITATVAAHDLEAFNRALESYVRERLHAPNPGVAARVEQARATVAREVEVLFGEARRLMINIGRETFVSGRHLLAAFLRSPAQQPPNGALAHLTAVGIDLSRFREAFRQLMTREGPEAEREVWQRLSLEPVSPRRAISRFNADLSAGPDRLGFEADVNAMASLIASKALSPPLSIGLFGNWGSGKSFFIGKLSDGVDELSRRAGPGGDPAYAQAYWGRIVHVHFNAWHYVDANLWASLVSHVFEELNRWGRSDDRPIREAREQALRKLRVAAEARAAAEARVSQAKKARDETNRIRVARLKMFDDKKGHLAGAVARDVWKQVGDAILRIKPKSAEQQAQKKKQDELLQSFGIALGDAQASAERVYRDLIALRSLGGRMHAVWSTMLRGSAVSLALAVGGLVALAGLALAVRAAAEWPHMSTMFGLAAQVAGMVSGCAVWVSRSAARVRSALEPAETVLASMERSLKQAEQAKAADIARLDKEVQRLEADCANATRGLDEAERNLEAARAELREAETGRLITRFIEQRATSTDYRKHLGIVAMIRDDFQTLSRMIVDFNDFVQAPERKEEGTEPPEDLGIHRIVLYIDDLDRCPPDRVVDVLQAIHLLLAFPLFVVVVAVDARWMSASLQDQYKDLLVERAQTSGSPRSGEAPRSTGMAAAPRDYLEKIFQVPYWIKPMSVDGCKELIDELVQYDALPAMQSGTGGSGGLGGVGSRPGGSGGTSGGASAAAKALATFVPESLLLDARETEAMKDLAVILGRSPRATKRFINVYRLIKAALPADDDGATGPEGFRRPMLLLAVATGVPHLVCWVFSELARRGEANGKATSGVPTFHTAVQRPPALLARAFPEEVRRLRAFASAKECQEWTSLPVRELQPWIERSAQFTFEADLIRA